MFKKELFVERLNLLIGNNKTSKQTLGDAIGVSHAAVSQFAHGANLPSIDKLVLIADYFNVSVDYLLGYPTHQKENKLTLRTKKRRIPA